MLKVKCHTSRQEPHQVCLVGVTIIVKTGLVTVKVGVLVSQ